MTAPTTAPRRWWHRWWPHRSSRWSQRWSQRWSSRRVLPWLVLVAVLLVATGVALWPRATPPGAPTQRTGQTAADLAPDRARAALVPCPVNEPAAPGSGVAATATVPVTAASPWHGVQTTCESDGAVVDLGAVLAGPPTLVNVWATWCTPCRTELPVLAAYAATPGAVRVLTVQVQSDQRDGLDLLASLRVRLATLYDGDGAVSAALKLPVGLPASYLVRGGNATLITNPRLFDSVDQVRGALAGAGVPS